MKYHNNKEDWKLASPMIRIYARGFLGHSNSIPCSVANWGPGSHYKRHVYFPQCISAKVHIWLVFSCRLGCLWG